MLNLYRRHTKKCPHRSKGQYFTKCSCPIWCDGEIAGKRYRRSLGARDWQRALRGLARFESSAEGMQAPANKSIEEAVEAFLLAGRDLAPGTQRNYRRTLRCLENLAGQRRLRYVSELDVETLDDFRASRRINALTWTKELQILRHFLKFCGVRKWTDENPARLVEMPKNIKPAPREPYTRDEIIRILAACDRIGRNPYERIRARAMALLLRYTGLRISDVATLEKERVRDGEIHLYTAKNGRPVRLLVPPELRAALDRLPRPRAAAEDCKYFFWSGQGSRRCAIRNATRTLAAVLRRRVSRTHRHTASATRWLPRSWRLGARSTRRRTFWATVRPSSESTMRSGP